jgi:cell division protein FtsQ
VTTAAPGALVRPRERTRRPTDLASRAGLISHQRRGSRRARRLRRAVRALGRLIGAGVVVAALVVVALVAADWLRRTSLLATRTVEVEGVHRLDAETVRAAAGVEPGMNLLTFDVGAAEARVGDLPGVRRAHVVRHLPGRVTVIVEEREPYVLVNADRLYWVDAEGYLVGADARPGATGLPILTGLEAPPGVGGPPSERLRLGLALVQALQRTGGRLVGQVSEVDLSGTDGPLLYLAEGIEVRVGREGWADRLARLDGVLAELDARGERVASIDLRFRDLVVLTPQAAGAAAAGRPAAPAGRLAGAPAGHLAAPNPPRLERR